jgi:hypothetical protein
VTGYRAAMRDATSYNRPGTARRYHVVREKIFASCSRTVLVTDAADLMRTDTTVRAGSVPLILRCQRRGCREKWPARLSSPEFDRSHDQEES